MTNETKKVIEAAKPFSSWMDDITPEQEDAHILANRTPCCIFCDGPIGNCNCLEQEFNAIDLAELEKSITNPRT